MKGVILDFSIQQNTGAISGDDQNRYNFDGSDWHSQKPPQRGDKVDFTIGEDYRALDVYIAVESTNTPMQSFSAQLDKISNQNQSEESFNMIDWFVKCLKNYANFSGRARRKEYWFFILCQSLILIIASIIDSIIFDGLSLFYAIAVLGLCIPSLAVAVRRLHDINKSGWWYLIGLVPIIGIILLIIWFATETKSENNQWGQPAK